ncbi:U7 snRNA-associated Sm-like protein LSm11 [Anguilla anguilla]|uniref:U7 snRNA-associated Sm-like protein LSm11 n=1 Tax=Anguilla anguilla TaxID=7936 RepID=UPI0015ACFBCF|nr:U7 snRNA-associated Sm-like protein LSm11 [Anguilla anguilla]
MEEGERKRGLEQNPARETGSSSNVAERGHDRSVEQDEIDSQLDVSSDNFDPLVALYSPQVPLPFPDIKCFNNIAEYESFLKGGRGRAKPENVEKRLRKARKGVPDPERIERLKKLMVNAEPEEGESGGRKRPPRKQKAPKNILTRMPLHAGSPLGELHRCVQERIRVKVHIRTFKGLRGVCSGFVVAFDKFWNMAMVDVDETYRKPLLGDAIHHERALTVTRLFDQLKLQERGNTNEAGSLEPEPPRSDAAGDGSAPPLRRSPRKGVGGYPRVSRSDRGVPGRDREVQGAGAKGPSSGAENRSSKNEPGSRVDYQRVHTRHINQLFIRGENILIINLQQ